MTLQARIAEFNRQVRASERTRPIADHPIRVAELAYELLMDLGYLAELVTDRHTHGNPYAEETATSANVEYVEA